MRHFCGCPYLPVKGVVLLLGVGGEHHLSSFSGVSMTSLTLQRRGAAQYLSQPGLIL